MLFIKLATDKKFNWINVNNELHNTISCQVLALHASFVFLDAEFVLLNLIFSLFFVVVQEATRETTEFVLKNGRVFLKYNWQYADSLCTNFRGYWCSEAANRHCVKMIDASSSLSEPRPPTKGADFDV